MQLSSNRALVIIARAVMIIVAAVFYLAATLKALDPVSFSEQIATYNIFPHLSMLAAWTLIIVEILLATALAVNFLPRVAPILMIALLLFFIGITWYGMAIGLGENCGCFGNLVHRGPEMVIIEDAIMAAGLLFSLAVLWTKPATGIKWKSAVTLASGLVAAGVTFYSPAIPADDIVTTLRPGARFDVWPVDGLYGTSLNEGTRVVFLFTMDSRDLQLDVNRMNDIAQQEEVHSATGLLIDGTEHLTALMFEYAAAFPVGAIEPRFARPLYRSLPRTFILQDGIVKATWSGLPDAAAVVHELRTQSGK
ncbi:MAG: hypothetical protein M5R41_09055 [Bacteroidia bacterium]|nr:hypothetical protein [Bacteroidia bacterium]